MSVNTSNISKAQRSAWKKQRNKTKTPCLKCGKEEKITKHHVIPKVHLEHFNIKNIGSPTVTLCSTCHREIEKHILWTEAFVNRSRIGERKPLHKADDYWYILSMFIGFQRFSELLRNDRFRSHPTIYHNHI